MMTRAELLAMIEIDTGLKGLFTLAEGTLDEDPGHNLDHALRVALWTVRIGGDAVVSREGVAAALLHDLVNLPKDSPERHLASERSAEAAAPYLRAAGFDEAAQGRIEGAIRDHSFSRGAAPVEALGCALQDADRLEALGAIGAFRAISTGTLMGSQYFHAADPWGRERDLDDKAYALDHVFVKLLRLPGTMRTEAGRAEATRRARVLIGLVDALAEELGVPLGPHPMVDALR
jgi:uncharacterized protein